MREKWSQKNVEAADPRHRVGEHVEMPVQPQASEVTWSPKLARASHRKHQSAFHKHRRYVEHGTPRGCRVAWS